MRNGKAKLTNYKYKVKSAKSAAILRHNKPWRNPWLKQRNSD